eukprot:51232_1
MLFCSVVNYRCERTHKYLVYGYIRDAFSSLHLKIFLPFELISICLKYYEQIFYWVIDKNSLNTFLCEGTQGNEYRLYSNTLKYNDYSFRFGFGFLSKNSNSKTNRFLIEASLPFVDEIICHLDILCVEKEAKKKKTRVFKKK